MGLRREGGGGVNGVLEAILSNRRLQSLRDRRSTHLLLREQWGLMHMAYQETDDLLWFLVINRDPVDLLQFISYVNQPCQTHKHAFYAFSILLYANISELL